MDWSTLPLIAPRVALLLAGLLLPGTMFLRALRLPWSLAASFVVSCTALYVTVLGCTFAHLTISPLTLGVALAGLSGVGWLVASRSSQPIEQSETNATAFLTQLGGWLPLYLLFWLVVAWRLATDPLSGPDVHFRWSYLAEQMLRFGSLDFYPAITSADFTRYFWPESIPPGIASVYAWAYACGGSFDAFWTVPVVALQLLSLHELVWHVAHSFGERPGGRLAVVMIAACPLLTWTFLLGQETGLQTIAVCGLVWCLTRRETFSPQWLVLSAVFAIAAASTREYGFVYAFAALGIAWLLRAERRDLVTFAIIAVPVVLSWPVHCWIKTGNPFYSLNVAGIFPTNPVFDDWNGRFSGAQKAMPSSMERWLAIFRYGLLWALPACVGIVALPEFIKRHRERSVAVLLFAMLSLGLWILSVRYTAGGLFYSLRVFAPGIALLTVVAGQTVSWFSHWRQLPTLLTVAAALILAESLPKTAVLPENPYHLAPGQWLQAGATLTTSFHDGEPEVLARVATLPGHKKIIADNFDFQRLLAPIGWEVIPLWSPEAAWLFDRQLSDMEAVKRWHDSGIRFVLIGRTGAMAGFLEKSVLAHRGFKLVPFGATSTQVIWEIQPSGNR